MSTSQMRKIFGRVLLYRMKIKQVCPENCTSDLQGIFKIFQDGEENNRPQMIHDGKWEMKGSQRVKMEKEKKIRERKYFCLLCPFLHDIVALCPSLRASLLVFPIQAGCE